MAVLSDEAIDAALSRGARAGEACATAVHYDGRSGRVVVDLANGCVFAFPVALAEGLCGASAEALAGVEVLPGGYGLHWEALDVDLSVPGLMAGLFGTAAFMARRAGQARSAAKAAAARVNGAKGGRPRRVG